MQYLGNPYVYGGTSLTNGTDCSGFTQGVMKQVGINTKPYIAEIIGSIVIAIILLIIPAKIGTLIVRLLGIAIMIIGVGLLFFEIKSKPLVVYTEEVTENSNKDKD